MVNPIRKILYGIKEKNLKYTLLHKYKEPIQMKHPYKTSIESLISIFNNVPREYWYNIIKPLIWDLNPDTNGMIILNKDIDTFPFTYTEDDIEYLGFNIEDLLKSEFDIEPCGFYTHNKLGGVFISNSYISLDYRYESTNIGYDIVHYGSVVEGIGVSDDGYSYGWEKGHYFLSESSAFYNNFSKINYIPKEGEFLYYIEKLFKRELTLKGKSSYNESIFGATSDLQMILGDSSNKEYFESFFEEYD